MPEFNAGVQKTAIVPVTNPTAKGFDYRMELYMGTNLAIMAEESFHLNALEQKDISLTVTMPTAIGVYPVHLGLYSGDTVFGPYKAEDVVITTLVPVTIDSLEVRFSGNTIYTRTTITNNTGQTLLHGGSFDTILHTHGYVPRPLPEISDLDLGPLLYLGTSVPTGTHTYEGAYLKSFSLPAYGVVEGAQGYADVSFRSTGPGPSPIVWYISIGIGYGFPTILAPMFGGKFSSSWQVWQETDWTFRRAGP